MAERFVDGEWTAGKELALCDAVKLTDSFVLASTVDPSDLLLTRHLEDWARLNEELAQQLERVLFFRKDTIGSSAHGLFLPPAQEEKLEGRHALLVLASIHSAEKLRYLVPLLSRRGVTGITVICLFNRMIADSAEFVSRLRTLEGTPSSDLPFKFIPVFNLPEFRSDDIERIQMEVTDLFSKYAASTPVPLYQRFVAQYDKYFQERDVTAGRFVAGDVDALPTSETVNCMGEPVEVTSEQGKMLALCTNLILAGDYESLIDELRRVSDKSIMFPVFSLLVGDIRFLRVTGRARRIYRVVREQISAERMSRLDTEKRGGVSFAEFAKEIAASIEDELHLLLGVVFLASFDRVAVEQWIWETLRWEDSHGSGMSNAQKTHPMNTLAYLSDERVGWVVSMLLRTGLHDFDNKSMHGNLRDQLLSLLRNLLRFVEDVEERRVTWPAVFDESVKNACSQSRNSLQLLLHDLGQFVTRKKYDVLRFLHAKIVTTPERHNAINTGLNRLSSLLENLLQDCSDEDEKRAFRFDRWARFNVATQKELQGNFAEALRTIGVLEQVADACVRLFEFAPIAAERAGRFGVRGGTSKFRQTIARMAQILETARRENRVSAFHLKRLYADVGQVRRDIWDTKISPLQRVLSWYVLPLYKTIMECMSEAQQSHAGLEGVWETEMERFRDRLRNEGEQYVLGDQLALREVLRNVFSNARHGLSDAHSENSSQYVECSVVTCDSPTLEVAEADIDPPNFVKVSTLTWGKAFNAKAAADRPTTIEKQRKEMEDFGSTIEIFELDEDSRGLRGARVDLVLIDRNEVHLNLLTSNV